MNSIESGNEVRKEIMEALNKADLGLSRGLFKLDELLEAKKPIAALIINKPGKEKKSKEADEATHDFVDVPDNQTQIKALDMLFKLNGSYSSEKIEHSGTITEIKEYPPEVMEMAQGFIKTFHEKRKLARSKTNVKRRAKA